jgi:anthranilate phosphoribosyltransferase
MKRYLKRIANGKTLSPAEAEGAMHVLLEGDAEPEEAAGFLMGLRGRGETIDELVGFTRSMREHAVNVEADDPHAIDLCGTGGDNSGTFNISTAASLVCAGTGVTVAKHGNRSVSSQSGSADVLEVLGVNVELEKEGAEHCLREAGIAFLFAPFFHPAMRFVMPVRKALGVRTFFNILGPLCNPAGVGRQLVGAFDRDVARQIAYILARTGSEHIVSVHAHDGMDEFSLAAPTTTFAFDSNDDNEPREADVDPEEAHGVERAPLEALQGGTAEDNAAIISEILDGELGPPRDVVVLNAAYALDTSGAFADLDACFEAAREAIDSGAARRKLDALVEASQEVRGGDRGIE